MTRIAPPLLGYNNNVRYLGRTFHIQTEDSGTKYARIMTHLFIDGGRIVKTTKTDYGAMVGQPDMVETVRRMMKEQHKNMFLSLRAGEFDPIIERVLNADVAPPSAPAMSQVPRLRADSLPSLVFGASEEPKTMPGLSDFVVDSAAPPRTEELAGPRSSPGTAVVSQAMLRAPVVAEAVTEAESSVAASAERTAVTRSAVTQNSVTQNSVAQNSVAQNSVAQNSVAQNSVAQNSVAQRSSERQLPAIVPKRPSARMKKGKSLAPSAAPRDRVVDDPTPADLPETAVSPSGNRPSERPSRNLAVRPPTLIQEAIDPRTQSIFGESAAGRQTLDEVILSFLEDEET